MLKTILLLLVGFIPFLWSLWVLRKQNQRVVSCTRQVNCNYSQIAQDIIPIENTYTNSIKISDRYYLQGVGYLIGDISCKFNARSGYVRCAVNPSGPCQNCRHYEA